MELNLLFVINSILLGVGLAMDAFSVSMANGLSEPRMSVRKMVLVAGAYCAFQFLMPMIGWICVHTIATIFTSFQKFIPWIALILLLYIGGGMLIEGIRNKDGEKTEMARLGKGTLLVQAVATSIDALSVGFTIADYSFLLAVLSAEIIGFVTFFICYAGIRIGKIFGTRLAGKANILGGVILIGIGIEIFVRGLLGI